jgi:hypothetical protein
VAVTANDRRAVNPLTIGIFIKVDKIPEMLEVNNRHNYRLDITFKTAVSANELLSHPCPINQTLRAFIQLRSYLNEKVAAPV